MSETFNDHILRLCPVCTAPTPRQYSGGRYYTSFVAHAKAMGWVASTAQREVK